MERVSMLEMKVDKQAAEIRRLRDELQLRTLLHQ